MVVLIKDGCGWGRGPSGESVHVCLRINIQRRTGVEVHRHADLPALVPDIRRGEALLLNARVVPPVPTALVGLDACGLQEGRERCGVVASVCVYGWGSVDVRMPPLYVLTYTCTCGVRTLAGVAQGHEIGLGVEEARDDEEVTDEERLGDGVGRG